MRRHGVTGLTLSLILAAAPAWAGEMAESFWMRMKLDFHRNNNWPATFVYADREAVHAPFAVMVHNGWRAQNTIGPYHFEEGSTDLTEAGRLKVQWILTQAPEEFRTIYVEQAESRQATAARLSAVRTLASRIVLPGEAAHVVETAIPVRGWSGESVDSMYIKYRESRPAPVLPKPQGEGDSGS
jgi:hypothetical protein